MHFEDCVGCARDCENTLRSSSIRNTAASRQAIYPAVRYLPRMSRTEPVAASARAILPSCTSKEETGSGYRRLHAAPERRGQAVNVKRVNRLYAEEGPVVRRRRRRRLMREHLIEPRLVRADLETLVISGSENGSRSKKSGRYCSEQRIGPCRHLREEGHLPPAIQSFAVRNLSALAITETELKLMAAAAIIGLRSKPNAGKSTPAASGTPTTL